MEKSTYNLTEHENYLWDTIEGWSLYNIALSPDQIFDVLIDLKELNISQLKDTDIEAVVRALLKI